MKQIVAILDAFQGQLSLTDVLNMSIPFADEMLDARLAVLKEKAKQEQAARQAAETAAASQTKNRVV